MPLCTHIDVGIRIQCLVLLEHGIHIDIVAKITNVTKSSIYQYCQVAIAQGYDPTKSRQILLSYLEDAPKSGRPTVCTAEMVQKAIASVTGSAEGRQNNTTQTGAICGISHATVHQILQQSRFRSCKRTVKPGLTEAMQEARY